MADMTREDALRKIQKLLRHAGGEGHHSEAEVENALRHARKMMESFNISLAEVQPADPADAHKQMKDRVHEHMVYSRVGKLDNFDATLADILTDICDVKCFYRKKSHREKKRGSDWEHWVVREWVLYVGLPEDTAFAAGLYMELLVTMRSLARITVGKGKWHKGHDSYCIGFVSRMRERARMIKNYEAQPATTAIVLAKDRVVNEWVEEKFGKVKGRTGTMRVHDSDAYHQGRAAADDVSLGEKGRVTV